MRKYELIQLDPRDTFVKALNFGKSVREAVHPSFWGNLVVYVPYYDKPKLAEEWITIAQTRQTHAVGRLATAKVKSATRKVGGSNGGQLILRITSQFHEIGRGID